MAAFLSIVLGILGIAPRWYKEKYPDPPRTIDREGSG